LSVIESHLVHTGEDIKETVFYDLFGSVGTSILTLYKVTTGGDDWSAAYEAVQSTGSFGGLMFLFFVAFVQFALVNIITGIFVDSAMAVLQPDAEAIAKEKIQQETEFTSALESLWRAVNADGSGRLSQNDFDAGMHSKHLPLVLKSLGFHTHHLKEFFGALANSQGQGVDIATFVNGCMLLKGDATNFDVSKLRTQLVKLDSTMNDTLELLREKL
jgi:hypothetical protein